MSNDELNGVVVSDFGTCFDSETGVDIRPRSVFASQELVEDWELYKADEPDVWFTAHEMEGWYLEGMDGWKDSWVPVSGPERPRSAVLVNVLKLFSWQSGVPAIVVSFLGLTKGVGRMDSWLMYELKDSHKSHLLGRLMHNAMMVADYPFPHFVPRFQRHYENERDYCKRCGERESCAQLFRRGVCHTCFSRGRRFDADDDSGMFRLVLIINSDHADDTSGMLRLVDAKYNDDLVKVDAKYNDDF